MILLIDNYDSFTYNLYQYLRELGAKVRVRRNDTLTVEGIRRLSPSCIVLSPGPGRPEEAGVCLDAVRSFHETVPILGVCLGHQAIARAFGGRVVRAKRPMHGKQSSVRHDGKTIFSGAPNPLSVVRYHSLVVEQASLPSCLQVSARTEDRTVMALRHRKRPVEGLQFHPESLLTDAGKALLANFLRRPR